MTAPTHVWLTAQEAAARARVGVSVVYREVKAGRLKAARVGGRRDLRFRECYIDEWLDTTVTPNIVEEPSTSKSLLVSARRRA